MRRSLQLAALALAGAALAPACFLDTGPLDTTGTGASGPTGGAGGGGTGGEGGAMAVCGDGAIEGAEQCDDGDKDLLDGCGMDCKIEPGWACSGEPSSCAKTCGDGKLDAGEACDDGGVVTGDGCNQGCQVEGGWKCDGGEPTMCDPACGDGILDGGESCDDMNVTAGDGCDADCKAEAGWMCSQPGNDPSQPSMCVTTCGDGIVAGEEPCDDGDTNDTNGCNMDCSAVTPGWTCDSTGGPASCQTVCGDGVATDDEECDDANLDSYDGCGPLCTVEKQCNNGVVDPGEECDGGPGCTVCALDSGNVCADATPILPDPMGLDPDTGVRVSSIEGDSSLVTEVPTSLLPACSFGFDNAVLHTYTTGKRPSILTVKTLNKLDDGTGTFDKTVLQVFRDCPGKRDVEACANNGMHASLTTGFLPANSTVFIMLAGDGGGDKGLYHIEVTEQPVKLFFHDDFNFQTMSGQYAPPADLKPTIDMAGAAWITCVSSPAPPCAAFDFDRHSRGGFGIGYMTTMDSELSTASLATPQLDLTGLQVARAQYTFRFTDGAGNDAGRAVPFDDTTPDMGKMNEHKTSTEGRTFVEMPKVAKSGVAFVYTDDGNSGAGKFAIDDIYVYGY